MITKAEKKLYYISICIITLTMMFFGKVFFESIGKNNFIDFQKSLFLFFIFIMNLIFWIYLILNLKHKKTSIFKFIFENANDAMAIIDKNGFYLWQNKAHNKLLNFEDKELREMEAVFYVKNTKFSLKKELETLGEFSGIFKSENRKGEKNELWISAFRVKDDLNDTLCYVEVKRDINDFFRIFNQIKKEKLEFEKKAFIDFLTGILNRNGFLKSMENLYPLKGCIIFADIDKFKLINDTYGHGVGDLVLKKVAEIIKSNLRETDLVSRWGGEEFVIWLDTSIETSFDIVEKIRNLINNLNPEGIVITCSFGLAPIENELISSITNADKALYRAKNSGRNKTIIYQEEK